MLLASNPHWQDKVRAEVKEVFKGETPSVDQHSKLTLVSISQTTMIFSSYVFDFSFKILSYILNKEFNFDIILV